jgi:hypothetical protein
MRTGCLRGTIFYKIYDLPVWQGGLYAENIIVGGVYFDAFIDWL